VSKGEYNSSKVLVHQALACLLVRKYIQEKRNIRMKEIDQMLDQWIHSSIIRAKLRELIINRINDKQIEAFKAGIAIDSGEKAN